jgi:sialic acid synthase SpsE
MVEIIAEFCQNHNGDFGLLREMVQQAAAHGATHGKIQTIFAAEVTDRPEFETGLTVDGVVKFIRRPYQAEYDRLKGLELSYAQQEQFIDLCREAGLIPMTTCFTRAQVNRLAPLPWGAIKVASYDCGSQPLIRDLAAHFTVPLYISTGATLDLEIEATAHLLTGRPFSFLHCVTLYPTPLTELHLARLDYLRQFTPTVGFSDHSLVSRDGVYASLLAIHLGATVIERHFTILKADQSKDGPVSIRPEHVATLAAFAQLDTQAQATYLKEHAPTDWLGDWTPALGSANRELSPGEWANRNYYRGRFASRTQSGWVYNWEDKSLV